MPKELELSFLQQILAFATLAGLGGVVHYLTTIKVGKKFKWSSFWIELVCSAFVGVIFGLFFCGDRYANYHVAGRSRYSRASRHTLINDVA